MDLQKNKQPLVSIVVITYNSAKYVLETLESAYNQIYQNIELIISDDNSTDNTVEICAKWIEKCKDRFIRVDLITSPYNTGISCNCNRGIRLANGEWLKTIAGDDALDVECIDYYLKYIATNNHPIKIIQSNMNVYKNTFERSAFYYKQDNSLNIFNNSSISYKQQYELLLRKNWISAPSIFFRKTLFDELEGFDENMPYEDWAFFLKITKIGHKIHFLNKVTVNYRMHNESFSSNSGPLLFNDFFIKNKLVYNKYSKNNLFLYERFFEEIEYTRKLIFIKFKLNRSNLFNRIVNMPFNNLFYYYKKAAIYFVEKKIRNNLPKENFSIKIL